MTKPSKDRKGTVMLCSFQRGDQELGSAKSTRLGIKLSSESQFCLLSVVRPQETHTQLPHLQNESS